MMPAAVIDLFIAGVQKGGTTALHRFLARHPDITMSSPKELHVFDPEPQTLIGAACNPSTAELARWFGPPDHRLLGEATPIYTYWPGSVERIRAHNPKARIIMLLRHPSFRAHSHWRMEFTRARDSFDFERAIGPEGRARVGQAPGGAHRVFSYVERGFYAQQVAHLQTHFPPDQLLFLCTEDLWNKPSETLCRIEDFLGLAPHRTPDAFYPGHEYVVPLDSRALGEMSVAARVWLDSLYHDDIAATARLTGIDLSDWQSAGYVERLPEQDATDTAGLPGAETGCEADHVRD